MDKAKNIQEIIENKLKDALNPTHLVVENCSNLHKGHIGDDGSGESHFSITIQSDKFKNIKRLDCHNMIKDTLKEEFKIVHSISISIIFPKN